MTEAVFDDLARLFNERTHLQRELATHRTQAESFKVQVDRVQEIVGTLIAKLGKLEAKTKKQIERQP